jgi:hypothetical protein
MFRFRLITIFFFFIFFNVHSQSYIDLLKGKTYEKIECAEIEIKGYTVRYTPISNKTAIEVNQSRLKGYYSERTNTYYYQKNGFKEKTVEGKINVYRAVFSENVSSWTRTGTNSLPDLSSGEESYPTWHLEKGSEIRHFLNQKTKSTIGRENNFKKEIFKAKIIDDSISVKELSVLGENPKIKNLVKIIKDYNLRHFHKTEDDKEIETSFSNVTFLRDGRRHKNPLKFTLNGENYALERNSKLELSIPNNKSSLICITNGNNNSCELIRSSSRFHEYFGLKINKKEEGAIFKINKSPGYFKSTLEYYEKKERGRLKKNRL